MAKDIDLTTFETSTASASTSLVHHALQGTVQAECIHIPIEFNAQQESASYSIEQIVSICGVARRTAFKYAAEVIEVHFWLKEADFRVNGAYNELALNEIKNRKSYAKLEDYRQAVHDANADLLQTIQQQTPKQPTEPAVKTSTLARFVEPDASPFSGLSITTKATDKREILQAELVETEAEVDEDFQAFMSLSTELFTQDEAAKDADDLEFQLLRKRNAAKWLKRKAILEADKQQILQGDICPKQAGNSPAAVS